jgi:hypothetical protein
MQSTPHPRTLLLVLALAGSSLACSLLAQSQPKPAQASVSTLEVVVSQTVPVKVMVTVTGDLPDGCTTISGRQVSQVGATFKVQLTTSRPANLDCTQALQPYEEHLQLDVLGLPAGHYTVEANGVLATFDLPPDSEPAANGQPTGELAQPVGTPIEAGGVQLLLPAGLADGIQAETIPAVDPGPDAPYFAVTPEHLELTLQNYVLGPRFHQPKIYIYDVAAYRALDENIGSLIDQLRTLLQQKPADPGQSIPFLPVFNAAQMMHVRVNYLDFKDGSGVRFITQYAQGFVTINNQDLFYTFQGLSADGKTYIAAILPLSHPGLPADESPPQEGYEAFAQNFQSYLQDTVGMLNAADGASFQPSLADLDALIASLSVP